MKSSAAEVSRTSPITGERTGIAVMVYLRTPPVQSPSIIITLGEDSLGNDHPPVKIP